MLNFRISTAIVLALLGGNTNAETLTILTWEAYFADDVIAQWEAATGAQINQIHFDTDDARNSILYTSELTQIDIVTIDPITAQVFGQQQVFLDVPSYKPLANLAYANADWAQRCAPNATPYLWGTLGLVYRKDKLAIAPRSWQDLLTPTPEIAGHIGLLENYGDTLSPSLLVRQQSPSSNDQLVLREVFEELKALLPSVLTFEYSISYIHKNPMDDALHLALGYSGDEKALNALSGHEQWAYVIPEEGSVFWGECLGILKNAPQAELAMDFINFLNTPEIAARNSETLGIATANDAAYALQSQAFRDNPTLHPDQESIVLHHYAGEFSSEGILLRNRIISTLVESHDSQ